MSGVLHAANSAPQASTNPHALSFIAIIVPPWVCSLTSDVIHAFVAASNATDEIRHVGVTQSREVRTKRGSSDCPTDRPLRIEPREGFSSRGCVGRSSAAPAAGWAAILPREKPCRTTPDGNEVDEHDDHHQDTR